MSLGNGPRGLVFLLALSWCYAEAMGQMWTKQAELFKGFDYNPNFPPPQMGNPNPLQVQFGISIKAMKYNIIDAQLTLEYWLRLAWLDTRLLYDGNDMFGAHFNPNASYLPVKINHGDNVNLWIPDVNCYNTTDAVVQDYGGTGVQAFLYPKEHVTAEMPYNLMLSRPSSMHAHCVPSLARFPFDVQKCALHFSSWIFDGDYLRLSLMGAHGFQSVVDFPDSNEYEWVSTGARDFYIKNTTYDAVGDEKSSGYSEVVMTVHLRRLPMYYMLNAILPMFMLVVLSSFAFWIPINPSWAGSGERMGFSMTCLLTIVAMGLFTADKRPMVSETTWLDRWISTCLMFTALPVVETIGVFFLDAIFRNMIEMDEKDVRKRDMTHRTKYTRYSEVAQEAHDLEATRSKRVMAGILLLKHTCPCGFFNPRGIDKWCRHIFPIITFCRMFKLLYEVSDAFDLFGRDASAYGTLFWPFLILGVCLLLLGLFWLIRENWNHCQVKRTHRSLEDESGTEDSASDEP